MKVQVISSFCIAALLLVSAGCRQIDRIYEKDTGEVATVPGPPAADAGYAPPSPEVDFVEPESAGDEDAAFANAAEAIEPLPEPEPEPAPLRTYTIQKGDSFWKIAKREYGDPLRMKDIEAANPGVDPKKLQIGDEILLPE
ncbi:MAG: LysM peptidoglycan-binding domain-containing protein [Planctomycetota bacterium]